MFFAMKTRQAGTLRSFERALRALCHDSVDAMTESELGAKHVVFASETRQAGTLRSFERALRPLCHDSVLAIREGEFGAKQDFFCHQGKTSWNADVL